MNRMENEGRTKVSYENNITAIMHEPLHDKFPRIVLAGKVGNIFVNSRTGGINYWEIIISGCGLGLAYALGSYLTELRNL